MNDKLKFESAIKAVKQKIPSVIILDAAIIEDGVVVFSVDNQPLLCEEASVRGLNGNLRTDADIIARAEESIRS